jgi:hypothetical protein
MRAAFNNPIRNLDALLFNWRRLGPLAWWRCLLVNSALKMRAVLRHRNPSRLTSDPPAQSSWLMHASVEN